MPHSKVLTDGCQDCDLYEQLQNLGTIFPGSQGWELCLALAECVKVGLDMNGEKPWITLYGSLGLVGEPHLLCLLNLVLVWTMRLDSTVLKVFYNLDDSVILRVLQTSPLFAWCYFASYYYEWLVGVQQFCCSMCFFLLKSMLFHTANRCRTVQHEIGGSGTSECCCYIVWRA